jgi:polysaccharide export outer membrane protein
MTLEIVSARTTARPATRCAAGILLALVAFCASASAFGQFSGPALTAPTVAQHVLTPTTDPALLNPPPYDFALQPGDTFTTTIYGTGALGTAATVGGDGAVQLPLIGKVRVQGLTVPQAEDLIANRLVDAGMYNNPQISITLSELQPRFVTVTGEMHFKVPVTGSITLLEALGAAGNFPPTASHIITIMRPGVPNPIVVDLGNDAANSAAANIALIPRDIIIVSRVGVVYVLGAFKTQGAVPLQQNTPLTLLQLTALVGGSPFEAKYKDLRIIRTEGLQRKLIQVNFKRIRDGLDPDPILAADDIVFMPTDLIKQFIANGSLNTIFSIADFFIYLRAY